jgi:hypothetical protein
MDTQMGSKVLSTFEPFVFRGGVRAPATPDFQPFPSVEPVCNVLLMAQPGRKHPEIVNECEGTMSEMGC